MQRRVPDFPVHAPATWHEEPEGFERAEVTRAIDGDTVEVRITGITAGPGAGEALVDRPYTVRLIGIDAPESVDPPTGAECFERRSAAAVEALLDGRTVRLVKDTKEADRTGRLHRYVYLGDEMANARLVANGYAYTYTYPPNVRHEDLFVALQAEASSESRGLWAPDAC